MNYSINKLKELIKELGVDYSPGSSATQGWTYNPIPFPGCDFPCHRKEASFKRWEAIDLIVHNWRTKTVLDVGCATGFFSFKAMKAGAYVIGIERDIKALNVCKCVLDLFRSSYGLDGSFILNIVQIPGFEFDIAFLLNVLNWMGREKAEKLLRDCSSIPLLFIEVPLKNDGRGGATWLDSEVAVKKWVEKITGHKGIAIEHSMGPGGKTRTLWKFEKEVQVE